MDTMNGKILKEGYTFDDLLLVPAYSTVTPAQVSLKVDLTKKIHLNIPVCAAAMDTVCEEKMAATLAQLGGIGFIHKNMPVADQAAKVKMVKETPVTGENAAVDAQGRLLCGAAVGAAANTDERVAALIEAGVDIIAVDSAHGHSQGVLDTVRRLHEKFPDIDLVGGNIVTAEAAQALIDCGASVVKVGIGPGSICTTRVVSGVGVPQLTAVNDVYQVTKKAGVGLIADGGIKLSGDVVKALAAGGDIVMLGSMLAGTEEAPGEVMEVNGVAVKAYVGMGSLSAMERGSKDRYFQGGTKEQSKLVPEGIEATVPYKGSVETVVYQMMGGLRSGMGYCGAHTVKELQEKAHFVVITNNGLAESHPHDVQNIKAAPNYKGK